MFTHFNRTSKIIYQLHLPLLLSHFFFFHHLFSSKSGQTPSFFIPPTPCMHLLSARPLLSHSSELSTTTTESHISSVCCTPLCLFSRSIDGHFSNFHHTFRLPQLRRNGKVADGYLNNPEQTDKSFKANPFGHGKMLRTGDKAVATAGEFNITGRLDDMVKINGQKIEPGEVPMSEAKIDEITKSMAKLTAENAIIGDIKPVTIATFCHHLGACQCGSRPQSHPREVTIKARLFFQYNSPKGQTWTSFVETIAANRRALRLPNKYLEFE